ncbi:MAG: efflux RND transporter permease subunit [Candidatus Aphodosoma sp.]
MQHIKQGIFKVVLAAISTKELFIPMAVATFSIAGMFFPMTKIITGPIGDFVQLFPWTILIALSISIIYAVWFTPYLCVSFIKPENKERKNIFTKIQNKFFVILQKGYEKLLSICFKVPWLVMLLTVTLICLGIYLFLQGNVQMMPKADRNCFVVEIHLNDGSSIDETTVVADSLARMMESDPRITSITSFVGMSSPRFHATYAPQIAKPSYAQFIVNTISNEATEELLDEYRTEKQHLFDNTIIRYKQMDYQAVNAPIEVYFSGEEMNEVASYMEKMKSYLSEKPELVWVHSDYDETVNNVSINLIPEESERLGITQAMLSLYLNSALGGQTVTSLWEGDYEIPVVLYRSGLDTLDYQALGEIMAPTAYPETWVPLRQIATLEPKWHRSVIGHRNSVPTITLSSDLQGGISQASIQKDIDKWILENPVPEGVNISIGGLTKTNNDLLPEIIMTIASALLVMFIVLLYHFRKLSISFLTLSSCILVVFGSFLGLYLFGLDLSITAILGIVSLIGVIVRNAIMMFEYAEELHFGPKKLSAKKAAYEAGKRRMRPIFLTSATTALGVIPMITAGTALWMPMGVVICFGTIFTLPLVVTVLPIAYWKVYNKSGEKVKVQLVKQTNEEV